MIYCLETTLIAWMFQWDGLVVGLDFCWILQIFEGLGWKVS
jgi:hypothetical protein